MTRWEKFMIWIEPVAWTHSKDVDALLTSFMQEGSIVHAVVDWHVVIRFRGKLYGVRILPRTGSDLSTCWELDDNDNHRVTIYEWLCPSRRVRVAFWEWIDKNGYGELRQTHAEIGGRNIRGILEVHSEAE